MKTNVVRRVVKIKTNSSVVRVLLLQLNNNKQQPSNVKIINIKDTTKTIKQ